jgi:hypothetical protein
MNQREVQKTRIPNVEARERASRSRRKDTFDISALFIIFSAAARLSSSVQPDAIIRAVRQISRNPLETIPCCRPKLRKIPETSLSLGVSKSNRSNDPETRYDRL